MTAATQRQTAIVAIKSPSTPQSLVITDKNLQLQSRSSMSDTSPLPNTKSFAQPLQNAKNRETARSLSPVSFKDTKDSNMSKTIRPGNSKSSLKRRRSLPVSTLATGVGEQTLELPPEIALKQHKQLFSISDSDFSFTPSRTGSTLAPLRDLSNEDGLGCSSTMPKRNFTTPGRKGKRSRLSLPNMTSPLVSKKASTTKIRHGRARSCAFDDSSPAEKAKSPVQNEQSRVREGEIHSDLSPGDNKEKPVSFQTFKAVEVPPNVYTIPSSPNTEKLMEIRKLVHAYTTLPEEKRFESEAARAVQRISGYPLVPSFIPDGSLNESRQDERRRKLVESLGERIKHGNSCKTRDAHLIQNVTECQIMKRPDGFVNYGHIPTSQSVSPVEYEERYMCMMDEVETIRSKSWGDYFAKLGQEIKTKHSAEDKVSSVESPRVGHDAQACSFPEDACEAEAGHAPSLFQEKGDDKVENGACVPEESAQVLLEVNALSVEKEVKADEEMAEADETCSTGETDSEHVEEAGYSVTHETEDSETCPHDIVYKKIEPILQGKNVCAREKPSKPLPRSPSPTSPDMLLPFPDRDDPSTHPLIARAEKKLWTTIDDALACYSQEVLEIQEASAAHVNEQF